MRVLFTTLPAVGHAAPLSAIATELSARGHDIAWVAHGALRHRLLPPDAQFFDIPSAATTHTDPRRTRLMAAVREYFGEVLPDAANQMLPTTLKAIQAFAPDVVVVEQNCLSGTIAARIANVPWVVVHVTPILLLNPFGALPMIHTWIDAQVGQVQRAHGVAALPWPIRSPHGTLVASAAAFLGEDADLRDTDHAVGALTNTHAQPIDPDEWLGQHPRIIVTLGTLTGESGRQFLDRTIRALAGIGSVLVLSSLDLPQTEGVRSVAWAPLPQLLPHVDAVLTHGGQNTVTESLLWGVPVVVAPVQFDQPAVAVRVHKLGAGLAISYQHATETQIREAVLRVLQEASFRESAERIGNQLGPGTHLAADLIEQAS